jgi:hypothetical protein
VLLCVAPLAPTNVGVTIAAQDSCSITTLTANGSPPTSPTRLPAGILRVTTLVLGPFYTVCPTWHWRRGWMWVGGFVPGPAVVLRGKGACRRPCRSESFFGRRTSPVVWIRRITQTSPYISAVMPIQQGTRGGPWLTQSACVSQCIHVVGSLDLLCSTH